MTAVVPEPPRRGQYLATFTWVDSEGGGDLHVNARMCTTCYALIDETHADAHQGWHDTPGDVAEPK